MCWCVIKLLKICSFTHTWKELVARWASATSPRTPEQECITSSCTREHSAWSPGGISSWEGGPALQRVAWGVGESPEMMWRCNGLVDKVGSVNGWTWWSWTSFPTLNILWFYTLSLPALFGTLHFSLQKPLWGIIFCAIASQDEISLQWHKGEQERWKLMKKIVW